jgi:hypothetical protein
VFKISLLFQALGTVLGFLCSRALELMSLRIAVAVRSGLTEMTSQTPPTSVRTFRTDVFNLTHPHSHHSHSLFSLLPHIPSNTPQSPSFIIQTSSIQFRQIFSGYGDHASSRHPTTAWRCLAPNRSGPKSMSTFKHDF